MVRISKRQDRRWSVLFRLPRGKLIDVTVCVTWDARRKRTLERKPGWAVLGGVPAIAVKVDG